VTARSTSIDGGLLAAGLLVAAAGAAFLALSWASTPTGFSHRVEVADQALARAEAAMEKAPRRTRFAPTAVCARNGGAAADLLRARVQNAAATAGVTLASVATAPAADLEGSGIAPVTVQFEASGRYDAVVSMLGALARQSPEIFTDSADLTSQVSTVDFKFSGEIYCSVPA